MSFMISSEEFIEEIRKLDEKLKNARLSSVEVVKDEQRIKYRLICDEVISEELQRRVWKTARSLTPEIFTKVNVYVSKIVSNEELINAEIFKYISLHFKSVAIWLKTTDVKSAVVGEKVRYVIKMTEDQADYFNRCKIFDMISEHLSKKFCSDFYGAYELKEKEEVQSLLSDDVYRERIEKISLRTIKVENLRPIDDVKPRDTATYIEDAAPGNVTLCGRIYEINERTTKNGKPFFVVRLDDTTGKISGLYFSRKTTYAKIKALKEGDAVIASGRLGEWNGNPSFTIERINGCDFPENFVKKEKFKKSAPEHYRTVFPSPAETISVTSIFDGNKPLPESFLNKEYVVFDLETTGLETLTCEIIEVGAVRIKNGKITEQFTTLVRPDGVVSEEITNITGIDGEMLKDAPKIVTVIPDFLKFVEGATVVAHNADYDVTIMKRHAAANDYTFNNDYLDTVLIAKKYVHGLKHYDLHTLAEHFNITFRHHRALSDAYATAEILIELEKLAYENGER